MLPPGPGTPAEDVARNQRARLFGAMVASVAERGYPATRISDLSEISGVSRNSFYAHFEDKEACFVAAMRAMLSGALGTLTGPVVTEPWEQQIHRDIGAFAALVSAQPAASRMCLIEAHAVGPEGLRPIEEAIGRFEGFAKAVNEQSPERVGTPSDLIGAQVGGLIEILRGRLRNGTEAELLHELPRFADLLIMYRPPPEPLRLGTRPPTPVTETIEGHDAAERALRALAKVAAEHGYANTTITQIVKSASMSPTTFYANFKDKEDALMAAIDSAGAQMVAAILPTFRRNRDWPHGIRAAFGAIFNFLATRPSLAQLFLVEVYAAGPSAIGRREEALRPLAILLEEGYVQTRAEVPSIATEAILGGIFALAYKRIKEAGPQALPALAPICTYFTLQPFIGPEAACAAANADGRTREHVELEPAVSFKTRPTRHNVLLLLSERAATASALAAELSLPRREIEEAIETLTGRGLIERLHTGSSDDPSEPVYTSPAMSVIMGESWTNRSLANRQQISAEILEMVVDDVRRAVDTETIDARDDRHLTRMPVRVDEQGWRDLGEIFEEAFQRIMRVHNEARKRLEDAGEDGIEVRAILALFESPNDQPKLGP